MITILTSDTYEVLEQMWHDAKPSEMPRVCRIWERNLSGKQPVIAMLNGKVIATSAGVMESAS